MGPHRQRAKPATGQLAVRELDASAQRGDQPCREGGESRARGDVAAGRGDGEEVTTGGFEEAGGGGGGGTDEGTG
jgi:hypothetical protein